MKKSALTVVLICLCIWLQGQASFTSVKQARYENRNGNLKYINGSSERIQISFNVEQGFIHVLNKDNGSETKLIDVVPDKLPNTWKGYLPSIKKYYSVDVMNNKSGMCLAFDDGAIVTLYLVQDAKSNK